MQENNHSKFHLLIQQSADGRLNPDQQQALDAHLAGCAECRLYAAELRALETQLASVSVTRLVPPASQQASLTTAIRSRYRRYQMNKQFLSFAGTLVALAAVAVLIVLFGHFVPRQSSPAAAPTATVADETGTTTFPTVTNPAQGQSLHFFTRAESDQLPLQSWQLTPYSGTSLQDPGYTINLTEAEAEQLSGFTVLEPTGLLAMGKSNLKGASFDPQLKIVRLFYYSGFVLREERLKTNDDCNLCGVVGASAPVETVQIVGDVTGEYVVGIWKLTDNGPVWESDPFMKRLRWQANGMAFELMYNPTYDPEAFTQTDMLAVAKSITYIDLTQVEVQVGYPIKALATLPTGYVYSRAEVNQPSNSVCLVYEYTGNDGPGPELWLAQGPIAAAPELAAQPGFAEARQIPVAIGGAQQAFSLSGMQRNGEWACAGQQSVSSPVLRLTWQAEGQQFDLYAMGGKCWMEEGYSDLGLLRLAEVMTGVSTHAPENHEMDVECERYQIGAMEGLVGFKVRYPQGYPGGMGFYGASYGEEPVKQMDLYYRRSDSNHTGLVIREMLLNPKLGNDLASQYHDLPVEGYQLLTVAGAPAVMILGDWALNEQGEKVWHQEPGVAPTLWFESKGLLIAISGPWLAEVGGNPQEKLAALAESIIYSDITLAEANSVAGFDVLEPAANLLESFFFLSASYNPENKLVRYIYSIDKAGSGEGLSVSQQPALNGVDCDLCGFVVGDSAAVWADHSGKVVGANAIETVQIGDNTGEYVEGVWTGAHNNGIWVWDPAGPKRLRWQSNGVAFELVTLNSSKNELIAIAESIR